MARNYQSIKGELQVTNISGGALDTDNLIAFDDENVLRDTGIPISSINESITAAGVIGEGEDYFGQPITGAQTGYEDGLFTDFDEETRVGVAVDRFNEVLAALAPPPAPNLGDMSFVDSGVSGKLSFGTSNAIAGYENVPGVDINGSYNNSGDRKGIFNATTTMNGVLAEDVAAHPYSYPANAFGNGNLGTLELIVNGSTVHTVDLTSFASGSTVNGNGSGFSLSAATPIEFDSGAQLDLFQYRTGTWTVDPADQRDGYNYVQVKHTVSGTEYDTETYDWVVDDNTTATSYAAESLSGLSMTGSKFLSGVEYHTGGSATYNLVISNLHRNTYSASGSAISHPTTTNCSVSNSSLGTISTEDDMETLAKTATVDSGVRILNAGLAVSTRTDRTVQSDLTSTGTSDFSLLVDGISDGSSSTEEPADGETFRVASNLDTTVTGGYDGSGNSPADWDSSISLVSATAGYSDGLLVENGSIKYPTQGTNGGDFAAITNGPAGNVDYSSATGDRVFLRYFYDSSSRQNFRFDVTASNTSFVSVATGPSANNLTFEVVAPNTTTDGVTNGVWKDATVAYTNDNSVGCYASSFGSTIPTNWGCTLGSKSTVTSGNVIVVRITAPSTWTGQIDNIEITWL